ncbi:MAG TPA: hypothetical protein VGF23_03985 [Gaiellaceae bacterium]
MSRGARFIVSAAAADTGTPSISVEPGHVRLVSGVYLVVPVTYTCPSSLAGSIFTDQVQVTVIENTSKGLARGTGGVGFQDPSFNGIGFGTPVICDDSPHQ